MTKDKVKRTIQLHDERWNILHNSLVCCTIQSHTQREQKDSACVFFTFFCFFCLWTTDSNTMTSSVFLAVYFLILLSQGLMPFLARTAASSSRTYYCRSYLDMSELCVSREILKVGYLVRLRRVRWPQSKHPLLLHWAWLMCHALDRKVVAVVAPANVMHGFPVKKGNLIALLWQPRKSLCIQ